ncbi:hypothetical protein NY2A_b097L [Paramecium bursaria Chlorella virus NY2A]|uniref:Uncharacterized protein b097L n=1 Tax=Paramecium bursaria Chlorella virus NY2A TaxID=46021 RepID=A7IVX2_PBCVN|nr:hypothetical protein NY2A_b097L [Paramecium bursaria Chlorella virus NY2A]YP_001498166.1 hypothetical protein AR158_c084L [Paramecium bursaria Chlorella virus AR158]ABT14496.1 hypothetical protein NY2A_b097L [Paramecium bursaria Chlorella virus NY2A]ABU43630.1 hypothetical protein AR158_c084L [Paramecium bursaria Chlorella virus AR158]
MTSQISVHFRRWVTMEEILSRHGHLAERFVSRHEIIFETRVIIMYTKILCSGIVFSNVETEFDTTEDEVRVFRHLGVDNAIEFRDARWECVEDFEHCISTSQG